MRYDGNREVSGYTDAREYDPVTCPCPNLASHKFSIPPDQEQIARNWETRRYSCDLFTDPPGREWNDFVHATNELMTVIAGKLRLAIGDEQLIAEPGDEVFISRGVVHSVKNIAASTTYWLYGYD